MTDWRPDPPVPAEADLTHYGEMPLEVRRLRDSGIAGVADAEVFRCAVLLWCVAWHQVPAGSLPDDDADLCRLVGLGRDTKTWAKIKTGALRGWRLFADGRLYHPVVSEKVLAGWNSTRLTRWSRECERLRKENKARADRQEDPLPMPPRPAPVPYHWPPERQPSSAGIPPETSAPSAGKSPEGKGREGKGREGNQESVCVTPSPVAATATHTARLIPVDWEPSPDDLAELRAKRPDLVGEWYDRQMEEFRDWCRKTAATSCDFAATWRGFMRKAHEPPKPRTSRKPGEPAPFTGTAEPWEARLRGYKPGGFWQERDWGPRPETGRCRAPRELIERAGIETGAPA